MAEPIKIDGLAQFSRNLKKLDASLPSVLRVSLNGVADLVVTDARPKVPRKTGRAQASMKARSTRTAVRVVAGGPKARYYPWLDFGGRVGRKRSVRRAWLPDGRFLYRSYFDLRANGKIDVALSDALLAAAASAGIEVT
jgi:hypothetical protein